MSAIGDCSCGCPIPAPVNIPGTPGNKGNPGTNGSSGVDAFTITTQIVNIPAVVGNTVTFPVANSVWMAIGQNIIVSDGTNIGNFQVVTLPGITAVVLKWLGYTGDSPANTPINSGATVSPAGIKGASQIISVTENNTGDVTFVPGPTAQFLFVECIGAGGQGGGAVSAITNSAAGGGGGGGAYSCIFITGPLKASYTIVIGSGGSGAAAGADGNPGGDTTFDNPSVCTASGGSGGIHDTVGAGTARIGGAGGAGGVASGVGDSTFDGSSGNHGIALLAAQAISGKGGSGPFGGAPLSSVVQGAGTAGGRFGSGGSGGCILSGGASVAGGNGANGLIRVWQFT
jgi:hypothetical protein